MKRQPWVEKYRPTSIDQMEQNEDLMAMFRNGVKSQSMCHYLFHGPPGTGKTSAIHAYCREIFGSLYNERVVEFNASHDRGIDAVRKKIYKTETKKFVCKVTDNGKEIPGYKVIILDEADQMTEEAQDALRVIIETYSEVTRFCFICNYISKITDAIKSRCMSVYFRKLPEECIIRKLKYIAEKESMSLSDDIYQGIIHISEGDMRRAIMLLQNVKTIYDYKALRTSPIETLSHKQARIAMFETDISKDITLEDLHRISCTISDSKATSLIRDTICCKGIREVKAVAKSISNTGLPIDDIMTRMYLMLLEYEIDDKTKAKLILALQKPLQRVKDDANGYIQLLDFLTTIYCECH